MIDVGNGPLQAPHEPTRRPTLRSRAWSTVAAVLVLLASGLSVPPAYAVSASASFAGGAGTAVVGGTLYAKSGATVTLTVATSNDTRCIEIEPGGLTGNRTSAQGRTSWTFTGTVGSTNGVQAFTIGASTSDNGNPNNLNCTGQNTTTQASYVADNAGPVVTGSVSPAPNTAGWNKSDVSLSWTAVDAGVGVSAAQPFQTTSVTSDGIATRTAPAQIDRLGTVGAPGATTVRIDKAAPSISASQVKNPDGSTTVTFTCADPAPGGVESSGVSTCIANGTTSDSVTVPPGTTVGGAVTDKAGNTATTSVTVAAGDTTAPLLSGIPRTAPNSAGWYDGDVAVRWTASDPESSVPLAVADTVITGEGTELTSSATARNGAGLTTTAISAPPVNIDRTAPATGISGTSNEWVNGAVTVTLAADDNLSGIAKTHYSVDGGALQTGSSFSLDTEGEHSISFFSIDKAGNTEEARTAQVHIDTTAPSIRHEFTPADYLDGAWTNRDVTVTFTCSDQGSGVAECTPPVTTSAEGDTTVTGTAKDQAGNFATDSATVRVDKTAPEIEATVRGTKNAAGWYNQDVTVEYTSSDALSGVASSADNVVLGEGADQSFAGIATDAAGNSASASVSGINVDTTAPVLAATFSSGWHTDDVTVSWVCTDSLSGPAGQPAKDVVEGEGNNLSSTASCDDVAGNTVTKTVTGINIDRSAPTTTAGIPDVPASGWFASAVPVTLTGSDNLSAVTTQYTINGGSPVRYDGTFELSAEGVHTVVFWSTDEAGNVETAGAPLTVQVDTTAPTTTVINPISPETGWFTTSGIPVAFLPSDSGSGVSATYYTIDGGAQQTYGEEFTADLSTGTHTITFWSVDIAGNAEKASSANTISVSVDTVAPMISGLATPAANAAGWNRTDVDVKFTCDDIGSGLRTGVAGCAGDTTLTNEGLGQAVTGDAVDVAGNRSSSVVDDINIDKTKPTLVGVPADPNAAGWHRGDVRVVWVGDDALSGIDSATQPADSTVTGEGVDLGTGPVTIRDKAGNTSDETSVQGINIDRTSPVVTGKPTTQANESDWYKGEVTVDFTCSDALSGIALCPTSKVLRTDGANQSVTSDSASDKAGNVSAGVKVGSINIDGTAPTSTSNNTCTAVNDFCKGDTATVLLNAADQTGLSGVREIRYSVDGGPLQVVAGASASVDVPLTGSGTGTVTYYAVDRAGNVENSNGVALKWDNIAPTVSHSLSPAPNADDWNTSDVTVRFSAKDDDKGSGVATVSPSVDISAETPGRVITGWARDTAGNVGTDSVTVKLDKTAPAISGVVTDGNLTASGWYSGPVTVTFTCSDALSGIATCPDPVILSANGTNAATGMATDRAGNTTSTTVGGIRIDQEKPTLTAADVNVQGGTYTLGSTPAASCTATDSYSGLASCSVTVTGGTPNGVGTWSYTATAVDWVGNSTVITGTYRVIYRFEGFTQPINDTAHQVGTSTSVFKAGSTVPVKFQLKNSAGVAVASAVAPTWLTPVKGSAMTAPVDESVYAASADSGSTYRAADGGQYIYNWKTGTGGHYWRIGVRLDDGQTYYVNIGLR